MIELLISWLISLQVILSRMINCLKVVDKVEDAIIEDMGKCVDKAIDDIQKGVHEE